MGVDSKALPQVQGVIDDPGLTPAFLCIVVPEVSNIGLGAHLNTLQRTHHLLDSCHAQCKGACDLGDIGRVRPLF